MTKTTTVETKRIPKAGNSIEGLEVVTVNGREIGFITKIRDTRSDLNPYKAFVGIGLAAKFVGAFYTNEQFAKFSRSMSSTDLADVKTGGRDAAVALVAKEWQS